MTASQLLHEAARRGLTLKPANSGRLAVIPARLCPPEFADILRAYKSELLSLLSARKPERVNLHSPLTESERVLPTITATDEYILQDRDCDYVEKVESGDTETVRTHFIFTTDIAKARHFSYTDLWSPLATTSIGGEFTRGFSGGRAIKMSRRLGS
jgi:hypothetical protein